MRITLLLLALFSATTIHAEPVEQVRDNCIIQLVNNDVDAIDAYLACSDFATLGMDGKCRIPDFVFCRVFSMMKSPLENLVIPLGLKADNISDKRATVKGH